MRHALGVVERLQNQLYSVRAEKDRFEQRYADTNMLYICVNIIFIVTHLNHFAIPRRSTR